MNLKNIFIILFFALALNSCICKKDWQYAHVTYSDGNKNNMYVCPLKNYYFDLIHARQNLDNKTEFLMPDKVNTVENKNYKYISLFFNEEDFGMESYGFGEVLAENEVAIVKTKYRKKTCACKTSGSFFKGYFLVRNNDIQLIETDKKLNILNKKEALHFLDEHTSIDLPQNINTIDELIAFIKNINN